LPLFNRKKENKETLAIKVRLMIKKYKDQIRKYNVYVERLKNNALKCYKEGNEELGRYYIRRILNLRKKIETLTKLIDNLENQIQVIEVAESINEIDKNLHSLKLQLMEERTESSIYMIEESEKIIFDEDGFIKSEEEINELEEEIIELEDKIISEIPKTSSGEVPIEKEYKKMKKVGKGGMGVPKAPPRKKAELEKEIEELKKELEGREPISPPKGAPSPVPQPQIPATKPIPTPTPIDDEKKKEKLEPEKIERYADILSQKEMELNKESIIQVSIKKEKKSIVGLGIKIFIETKIKLEKEPEIEILIMAPGFDVFEPRKKLKIPLDSDSDILEFKLIPKEIGKKYVFVEIYQEGKMIGRAVLEVQVRQKRKSTEILEKPLDFTIFQKIEIDATLRIIRYENKFVFCLFSKYGGTIIDPKTSFCTTKIDNKYINTLNKLIRQVAFDFDNFEESQNTIINLGKKVYDLIPEPIQEAIKKINPKYLIFETGDLFVPFELAHDGEDFLCLKYCIGKRILDETKDFTIPPTCFGAKEFDFIVIESNPKQDLQLKEKEMIKKITEKFIMNFMVLKGTDANKDVLRHLILSTPLEIIHFAGHGRFDDANPEKSGILLEDGILTANEINKLKINGFPLVFINACESATLKKINKMKGVGGLARSFLGSGAIGFIGPLWEITDDLAAEFATEFYEQILVHKKSVGEAIKDIKLELKAKYPHILWATFNYYGDPTIRLCPKTLE